MNEYTDEDEYLEMQLAVESRLLSEWLGVDKEFFADVVSILCDHLDQRTLDETKQKFSD